MNSMNDEVYEAAHDVVDKTYGGNPVNAIV